MLELNPRETIINLIKENNNDVVGQPYYKKKAFLRQILLGDILDLVFYVISLQPDLNNISRIDSDKFSIILEKTWREWVKRKKNRAFLHFNKAWRKGSGPMGEMIGEAELYAYNFPGYCRHGNLYMFFTYPKQFLAGWNHYRDVHVEYVVFLKWKQENNIQRVELVLDFAEIVCKAMREYKNTEK
jgi:hypothetical protein